MRIRFLLTCVVFCLAAFGPSRPGFAAPPSPIPADLFDHLQKQGWTEVRPGVMQRSLGGNRVETLGFGAAGLRFQLQVMKAHLVDLRKDYAQHPSRQLRSTIRSHRAQILRVEEALRKARPVDGLAVSAEGLIADDGNGCTANYDASALAFPIAQGDGSKAAAYFNNACGYIGEVYAHSKSKATAADSSVTITTHSDPALNSFTSGTNVSANAATSVNGVTACDSYAFASVMAYDLGVTYSQTDQNYSCVASLPSPWTKTDVGTVGLTGGASHDNGVFKLTLGGTDLAGTADAFHFVHQTLSGDGTIVANVSALLKPAGATRTVGGVTFRNDLTAGSAHATMTISSEGEAQFRRRATAGGTTASTSAATTFAPQWLKIDRIGNTFTAYLSDNGISWTQVGTPQTLTMSTAVQVGLVALRNGSSALAGAARFEHVNVSTLTVPAQNYFAVTPCRLLDTRNTTILTDNQPRTLTVAGSCGIPSSAHAVSVNVTAISPTDTGKIALYPGNLTMVVSSLNFAPATSPRSNSAIIQLATNGAGTLGILAQVAGTVAGAPRQVHMTLDVDGYFSTDTTPVSGATGPLGFQTLPICRIANTTSSTALAAGVTRTFTAQGVCGVPAGAAVASLHVGATTPTAGGQITLFPSGLSAPGTSSISFPAGTLNLRNGARVKLSSTAPDLSALFSSTTVGASTHAHFDVNGYFKSDAPLKYRPITPCRVLDTAGSPLATGTVRAVQAQGTCGIPVGAKAVAVRLVVSGSTSAGDLTVFASNSTQTPPAISTLKFDANELGLSVGTIVPLSTLTQDLAVVPGQMTSGGTVNLAIDVFGYFQ